MTEKYLLAAYLEVADFAVGELEVAGALVLLDLFGRHALVAAFVCAEVGLELAGVLVLFDVGW